ncbi:chemotaxis protein CheW [Paenibacillus whitsoniae]|uniref:Chemotaxis protein CheW n=1 Tax=Paenibacillus whitsoniae TaxID=2496558 RepID=A0A3S0ARN0_9BACL|nr:chemotaxis protein CheW [Paenibacillus whitsoniae]RTE10981.1 chemotaxis protein CheW [Paenibacillus whitsoniae]
MQTIEQEQYVELGIGHETYAIRIQAIHEIIKMQEVTQIPNAMAYLKGVINLRGKIIPVISLRNLFGLMEEEYTKFTRIVVVNHAAETVGIIVDRVNKVTNLSDIQPPPDCVGGISGNYFAGIGITSHGLVGILKLEEVLLSN